MNSSGTAEISLSVQMGTELLQNLLSEKEHVTKLSLHTVSSCNDYMPEKLTPVSVKRAFKYLSRENMEV